MISIDPIKINKIITLQKAVLQHLTNKLNVKYHNQEPINNEDPFTYDLISEIPEILKFSYKDAKNTLYTFNCIEFDYFIRKYGAWNPYTKEEIAEDIILKLNNYIKYNKLERKSLENNYDWKTPQQAYTDVSHVLEKIGFYTDISWFMKLSYKTIKLIIMKYRMLSVSVSDNNLYLNKNLNKNNYIYDFAKEIIKLAENGDEHYLLCCNLINALALYSRDFYNNMPQWLIESNIENNINIVENQHLNLIYFFMN